jgi:hypothetical protein
MKGSDPHLGVARRNVTLVELEIVPEPSEEERRAILAALAAGDAGAPSAWWQAGLDDLRDGALAEQAGGDAGVVEP